MSRLNKSILMAASLVAALVWATAASADTVYPANYSFENDVVSAAPWYIVSASVPASWTNTGDNARVTRTNFDAAVSNVTGNQWVVLGNNGSFTETLSQTLRQYHPGQHDCRKHAVSTACGHHY